jgi:hypothetical protein
MGQLEVLIGLILAATLLLPLRAPDVPYPAFLAIGGRACPFPAHHPSPFS